MITSRPTSILLLTLVISFTGCTPHIVHEAQRVVAEADSLWRNGQMYGVDSGDSATLAQAYETLGAIPFPVREGLELNNTFTRSCYHYGKLLRKKDNPVEAMQAFIRATHAHSRDYHYLGRIYNNIGDICHLAGEFSLSYDMFERSADMYLRNRDTLLYYYCLNDMAFELASLKNTDSCLAVVEKIMCNDIKDNTLIAYCSLTYSRAYYEIHNYDSAIYYARNKYLSGVSAATLLLAQSYSHLGNRDSAVYYAKKVLKEKPTLEESNNVLYILTNKDEHKDVKSILKVASDRADTQKLLEIRQGKLSQATQLLEQDLNSKPDRRWIFTVISALLLILVCIFLTYIWKKRKQHLQIIKEVQEQEEVHAQLENTISNLSLLHDTQYHQILSDIEKRCTLLRNTKDLKNQLHWRQYDEMCSIVDNQFYLFASKLKQVPTINERDVRMCILVLLGLNQIDIANLMYVEESSVGKLKERTGNKLHTSRKNLRQTLLTITIEGGS